MLGSPDLVTHPCGAQVHQVDASAWGILVLPESSTTESWPYQAGGH